MASIYILDDIAYKILALQGRWYMQHFTNLGHGTVFKGVEILCKTIWEILVNEQSFWVVETTGSYCSFDVLSSHRGHQSPPRGKNQAVIYSLHVVTSPHNSIISKFPKSWQTPFASQRRSSHQNATNSCFPPKHKTMIISCYWALQLTRHFCILQDTLSEHAIR